MRRKSFPSSTSSLVFTKRELKKNRKRRAGSSKRFIRKIVFIGLFVVLSMGSIFGGYLLARSSYFPAFIKNKEPEAVIKPINITGKEAPPVDKLLQIAGVQFEEISYATTSSTLIITLEKDSFVYFDTTTDISSQITVLKTILKRMKIDNPGKKINYIDLRFGKPIIKSQ